MTDPLTAEAIYLRLGSLMADAPDLKADPTPIHAVGSLWGRAIARHVLIGANIVSVRIVATAAVRSSANGSCAYRCRSDTVAPIAVAAIAAPIAVAPVACAAHCNSAAAPRSSNCDRTAAVTAATPIGTSAAPSLGIIGDQAGDEQNESGKRSENIAEHDRNPSMKSLSPAREIAALSAQEVDVDQSNLRTAAPTLCSRTCQEKEWSLPKRDHVRPPCSVRLLTSIVAVMRSIGPNSSLASTSIGPVPAPQMMVSPNNSRANRSTALRSARSIPS